VGLSYSWSCYAGGRRFESRPWHYSISRSFSSKPSNWQGFLRRICHLLSILNLFRISSQGEAVYYRPCASPSFEVSKLRIITIISAVIIINLTHHMKADRIVNILTVIVHHRDPNQTKQGSTTLNAPLSAISELSWRPIVFL